MRLLTVVAVVASSGLAVSTASAVTTDPTAVVDKATVRAGGQTTVDVLANDACAGRTPCRPADLTALTVGTPSSPHVTATADLATGHVTLSADGTATDGIVTVGYTITDAQNRSASSHITLTVTTRPVAVNDAVTVKLAHSATIDVLRNDTCAGVTPCSPSQAKVTILKPLPHNISVSVGSTDNVTVHATAWRRIGNVPLTYRLRTAGGTATATLTVRVRGVLFAPSHYSPGVGATFNDPLGNMTQRRVNIHHVVSTINAVRGYRVRSRAQCPANPALWPNEIKISLYSIADMSFVDALIRADRRCVSVQLLMNNHLDATTSPSWGHLLHAIGGNRTRRSWTHRCVGGCRSYHGVEHAKFYLFSQAGSTHDVIMVGSSNMTSNATHVQWNDLFTLHSAKLYGDFRGVFEQMKPDRPVPRAFRFYTVGRYQVGFWPQPRVDAKTDQMMKWLRTISCTGATGGAGFDGHTVVYINIHAWHSKRGLWIAQEVRHLWATGCYVKILYSFMSRGIFDYLRHGAGSRMVLLRTIFPNKGLKRDSAGIIMAGLYSHMKNIAVSGNVAGVSDNWVTWTGSNNFTNLGTHSDEVMIRIVGRGVYERYAAHWRFIAKTKSSPTWAHYDEPTGGGRAPDETARFARTARSPGETPGTGTDGAQPAQPLTRAQRNAELPALSTVGQDMD